MNRNIVNRQHREGTIDRVSLTIGNWVALMVLAAGSTGSTFLFLDGKHETQAQEVRAINNRVIRLESSGLTSEQADEMSASVTRLSVEMLGIQSAVNRYEASALKSRAKLEIILEKLNGM
jgi:hypothetical protein